MSNSGSVRDHDHAFSILLRCWVCAAAWHIGPSSFSLGSFRLKWKWKWRSRCRAWRQLSKQGSCRLSVVVSTARAGAWAWAAAMVGPTVVSNAEEGRKDRKKERSWKRKGTFFHFLFFPSFFLSSFVVRPYAAFLFHSILSPSTTAWLLQPTHQPPSRRRRRRRPTRTTRGRRPRFPQLAHSLTHSLLVLLPHVSPVVVSSFNSPKYNYLDADDDVGDFPRYWISKFRQIADIKSKSWKLASDGLTRLPRNRFSLHIN